MKDSKKKRISVDEFNGYVFNILLEYTAFIYGKLSDSDLTEMEKNDFNEIMEKIKLFNDYLNQKRKKDAELV